jgi:hypothetical protein
MKHDGSGAASTSQRIEEFNVLLLEIEAAAMEVVVSYCAWTAELQRY